ncbi:NAD(P)H-dependent oxidoreductase [Patescibacteria group bacterium]|nr:NAD(P)H-dependent oxidoreductase [Patescibacteria group bacterium]
MTEKHHNIALVLGSVRQNRQGIKVAHWLARVIEERGFEVDFIDMKEKPLPFLDKRYVDYADDAPRLLKELHERLMRADGYLFVTPEYNHSVPAALKNFLDHFGPEFYRKPAAVVSYSASKFGGIRVIDHLSDILLALGLIVTPNNMPISQVEKTFDDAGNLNDERYIKRVKKFIDSFIWYLETLSTKEK